MERLLFIYNPHAGRGAVRPKLAGILNAFTKAGQLVTVYPTQGKGDATRAAAMAPEFDRLAVCGGDGTLHEVVNGLMALPEDQRPPVGYIPAGTTNDFSRNLNLPRGMENMARTAVSGTPRPIDIGRLNDRFFVYVAAFGAFTDVAYSTPQEFKNIFGHLAYLLQGMGELANLKGYHLKVEHDRGSVEGNFLYGMFSNTISVGGLIDLPADQVALDDGLLESILVVMPKKMSDLQTSIHALAHHEYTRENGIVSLRSSRFRIISAEPLPMTLDGEYGGSHQEAVIEAMPRPIEIIYGA